MCVLSLLLVATLGGSPGYRWSTFELPPEMVGRMHGVRMAFSEDGSRLIVVTGSGGVLCHGAGFQNRRVLRFDVEPASAAIPDDQHVLVTGRNELFLIATRHGRVVRRHRVPGIRGAALLPTGLVAASTEREPTRGVCGFALISPKSGRVIVDCGDGRTSKAQFREVGCPARFIVCDPSGTRFAAGSHGGLWVVDICTQQTRAVAGGATLGNGFYRACFDPSGRYLLTSFESCEIMVFDLMKPYIQSVSHIRETPQYVGDFGISGRHCAGLGFIGERWFWFSNGSKLYFCSWPDGKIVGLGTTPRSEGANDRVWTATRDGRLLAGVDESGLVRIGCLRAEPHP